MYTPLYSSNRHIIVMHIQSRTHTAVPYVRPYIYVHIYTYICKYITRIYVHTCIYVCMYARTCAYMCIYNCTIHYILLYIYIYILYMLCVHMHCTISIMSGILYVECVCARTLRMRARTSRCIARHTVRLQMQTCLRQPMHDVIS